MGPELTEFCVGDTYTNDQIRFTLGVENLGGIRPSIDGARNLRHLAIMTAAPEAGHIVSENPYMDRIEGDVLLFTGQGRSGHQTLTGRNKRLLDQYSNPVAFFGFQNIGRQRYRFMGLLETLRHYQETQIDKRGYMRRVWLFEFRIHHEPTVVPLRNASDIMTELLAERDLSRAAEELDSEIAQDDLPVHKPEEGEENARLEVVRRTLLEIPPYDFEYFVKELMLQSGFIDVAVTPRSGDGGIDVNAYAPTADAFFAGTHVQVQVKRWRHAVGCIDINSFRGAVSPTAKGVFLTTSVFTRAAVQEARSTAKPCISLIDGLRLSGLVVEKGMEIAGFRRLS